MKQIEFIKDLSKFLMPYYCTMYFIVLVKVSVLQVNSELKN